VTAASAARRPAGADLKVRPGKAAESRPQPVRHGDSDCFSRGDSGPARDNGTGRPQAPGPARSSARTRTPARLRVRVYQCGPRTVRVTVRTAAARRSSRRRHARGGGVPGGGAALQAGSRHPARRSEGAAKAPPPRPGLGVPNGAARTRPGSGGYRRPRPPCQAAGARAATVRQPIMIIRVAVADRLGLSPARRRERGRDWWIGLGHDSDMFAL
jgi:hypothetical protein